LSPGLLYAISIFVISLATLGTVLYGNRALRFLKDVPPLSGEFPKVSIIVAARNEAKGIEKGARSLLKQDYPNLEVVVVNDRSVDGTGEILGRLRKEFPALRAIEILDLSPGWLGKNHAHWKGALDSTGEYLLFTDGDVVMEPTAISRAMGMVRADRLDHLAVVPQTHLNGILLRSFMGYFTMLFLGYYQVWQARNPKSKSFVGIGAFNLVARSAYLKMGTHERIRMRPDDDLKLGHLLKKTGARQDCAFGKEMVSVEWYHSFPELVRGLEKNSFAGFEYRIGKALFYTAMILLVSVGPFVAPWILTGWGSLLSFLAALFLLLASYDNARFHVLGSLPSVLYPFAALLFTAVIWNAIIKTLWRGGIEWRGTLYPLNDLRRNEV
jgi:cellulose synthase/poly-beta-1,6-N-acetylglucosamine synthase-like glycosyltransferase